MPSQPPEFFNSAIACSALIISHTTIRSSQLPVLSRREPQSRGIKGEHVHRLTVLTGVVRSNGITLPMSCPEYLRLRQHYDAALRPWAQIEVSSHEFEVIGASARMAEKVRRRHWTRETRPVRGCVFMGRIVPPATRGANLVAN